MSITVTEEWNVCDDCVQIIANDDASGLDYYLTEEEAKEKLERIYTSLNEAGGWATVLDERDEFSTATCDCCRTRLAGSRTRVDITK